ncbi:MAG: hypothetical protein ASARMPREDX12_002473 [Alectoria sarmentosa]|nr:MAG: hypothetical protein ASARMPREDX12_002473 [Alectoria sarmentosa]
MSAGHNEPRLLYSVGNISAYHIQDGQESPLSHSGPQTLSLLMVPTSSPFADLSSANPSSAAPEEDFYLHLHLPPELDLSLPATTQIYHQPPRSYLIPRWDLGPGSGAFTRIEFPKIGTGPDRVTQEDVDTFETILAQCTAFLERASFPSAGEKKYNPAEFPPGEGYVGSGLGGSGKGHIVLVDEEDGSVVGELGEGFQVVEGKDVHVGSKRPVEIQLPQEGEGNQINVTNASEEYLKMAKHPAYKDSTLVQNAAVASRLIVTGSGWLANQMTTGADSFTKKTKPNPKPMTFTPTTQARVRKLNSVTQGAVSLSAKTVGQVTRHAQNLGATLTRRSEQQKKNHNADREGYKPGLLNKSMMAFSTIADGVDYASRSLLSSGSSAATQVVGHRYGENARNVAGSIAGGVRNVGLVYVDAAGVSRRAVIKSVAKGMVVGKAPGGGDLIVGGGDGGAIPPEAMPAHKPGTVGNQSMGAGSGTQVGFGNKTASMTEKSSSLGEPMGS